MGARRVSVHGEWSSRLAFVLAATGSAVGLGNIWKFPYMAGENGGGAFVLVYLLCVACVGVPVMMAEVLLGRRGRRNPLETMATLAREEGRSAHWRWLGGMGIVAAFLILSFYSVIAGWTLAYVFRTAGGVFDGATATTVNRVFAALVADPERLLAWHTIFMGMTMIVVARGVRGGLERAVRFLMPALFVLLIVLVGYALNSGRFDEGLRFLFAPDFGRLTAAVVLAAVGQAFFSLSLGMGAIMIYGSYLPHGASIARTSMTVAAADTAVALLAGLAIFPILFAEGLHPDQGPSLIFKALPLAFGHMPGGAFFGTLFFVLLVFAAWTSAISLLEPPVTWLVENRGMSRVRATVWAGVVTWLLGLCTVFSFNLWSGWRPLAAVPGFAAKGVFDIIDFFGSDVLLPLGGLLISVFAGWVMARASSAEELGLGESPGYRVWRFLVRYVTPAGIGAVFLFRLKDALAS